MIELDERLDLEAMFDPAAKASQLTGARIAARKALSLDEKWAITTMERRIDRVLTPQEEAARLEWVRSLGMV